MAGEWRSQWEFMTIDELFALREQMQEILSARLKARKVELESQLQTLSQRSSVIKAAKTNLQS